MVYDDGVLYLPPRRYIPIWSEDRRPQERPDSDDSPAEPDPNRASDDDGEVAR